MFGGYITERVSIEFVGYAGALILTIALVMAKVMLLYNITPAAIG